LNTLKLLKKSLTQRLNGYFHKNEIQKDKENFIQAKIEKDFNKINIYLILIEEKEVLKLYNYKI